MEIKKVRQQGVSKIIIIPSKSPIIVGDFVYIVKVENPIKKEENNS